ncbi:hypothetical protein D3C78_1716750 [compost metagenome]
MRNATEGWLLENILGRGFPEHDFLYTYYRYFQCRESDYQRFRRQKYCHIYHPPLTE